MRWSIGVIEGSKLIVQYAWLGSHEHHPSCQCVTTFMSSIATLHPCCILSCKHLCCNRYLFAPVFFHVVSWKLLYVPHLFIKWSIILTPQMMATGTWLSKPSLIPPAWVVPLVSVWLRIDLSCDWIWRWHFLWCEPRLLSDHEVFFADKHKVLLVLGLSSSKDIVYRCDRLHHIRGVSCSFRDTYDWLLLVHKLSLIWCLVIRVVGCGVWWSVERRNWWCLASDVMIMCWCFLSLLILQHLLLLELSRELVVWRVYQYCVRSPLLVVRVEHDHFSDLLFYKPIKYSICHVYGIFFDPIGNLHRMLNGCICAFSYYSIHDSFVYLVWKNDWEEDVANELSCDLMNNRCHAHDKSRVFLWDIHRSADPFNRLLL